MAIVLCMNCGKPRPVPPWKSTRVVKVSTCPKCKPQTFREVYKATTIVITEQQGTVKGWMNGMKMRKQSRMR